MRRLRARGARGTHSLVHMVREQVAVLTESTGKLSARVDQLRTGVQAMGEEVIKLREATAALGAVVTTLAESVDDHEVRLAALEKKPKGRKP